ncbi:M28 family peptidase, partial [candidate division WOR-3 bacterium]|nr:M28 family peptidase [candidate division WOR-3 bacterium]
GAEEFGLLGSFNYVNNNKNKGTEFVINIDVTGDDIGTNNIIVTGDRILKGWIKRILKREKLYAKIKKNIYSSDSIPFGKIDIPSINIYRGGGIPSFYIHTEGDSSEVIGYGLYQTYSIVKSILRYINKEGLPEGMKIPRDIKGKINKYIKDRVEFS